MGILGSGKFGQRSLQQRLHNFLCAGIRHTPPLQMRPAPLLITSLVSARDFLMYLVAIKSLYAQIGVGGVCAINDGSLDDSHLQELRSQIPAIRILHIADAPKLRVPKGGCWERLTWIAELAKTAYVIQLDSDTLTRGPCPEVCTAWQERRPFILAGDRIGAQVLAREEISWQAARLPGNHVQTIVERSLASVRGIKPFYVRGSGGFFGVPLGTLTFQEIEEWSDLMAKTLGGRWREWGTEQATVNYLLANMAGLTVLQPPKYANRWREKPGRESTFIHFIGTHRFDGQFYACQSRRVIQELRRPDFPAQAARQLA